MSHIFYDKLLALEDLEKEIKKVAKTSEEKEELTALVDEIIHHKVMGCILDKLPRERHHEFLEIFEKSPHDEDLLFGYLRERVGEDVEDSLKQEIDKIASELWTEITKG